MLHFTEKELDYIKLFLIETKENSTDKKYIDVILENINEINEIELLNGLLFDILDEYYATYLIKGFKIDELEDMPWINKEDISIYKKIYQFT